MKDFRRFLLYVLFPLILAVAIVFAIVISGIVYPEDTFSSSYQSVIQTKYENLVSTNEPKIIIVSGSSAGFGIDEALLKERTGYEVVNMGLHAGFGGLFNTEISKANINKGDIVLVGYEYDWIESDYFDHIGVDLVMSGIDSNIEMYKYIPAKNWAEIVGYFPDYIKSKKNYTDATGVYSRAAFDENGSLNLERGFAMPTYEEQIDIYKYVDLTDVEISEGSSKYLKKYKEYVEDKGASIYFISPPLYEKAKWSSDQTFIDLVNSEESSIGIDFISNPLDYVYTDEYMFDSIYHCSSTGEIKRTEQLASDLAGVGISK